MEKKITKLLCCLFIFSFLICIVMYICHFWIVDENKIVCIENNAVKEYLNCSYVDFNECNVDNFTTDNYDGCSDKPFMSIKESRTVLLSDSIGFNCINNHMNLAPGKYFYLELSDDYILKKGSYIITGRVRMIDVDGIYNVRDIGGWQTSSGSNIIYGKIFRGSELFGEHDILITSYGIQQIHKLGVDAEIDLRSDEEVDEIFVDTNCGLEYERFPVKAYLDGINDDEEMYVLIYQYIFDSIDDDKTLYIHCWGGCDRTGTVIAMIEGLLGVSKEDIIRDYELSSFSAFGVRKYGADIEGSEFKELLNYVEQLEGDDYQNKFEHYFLDLGFEEKELDDFISRMVR